MKDKNTELSIYLSYLLRHKPEEIGLNMDHHGWVKITELINGINTKSKYRITEERLTQIVAEDAKGRYKIDDKRSMIKACQGHSIPWVEPELTYCNPPDILYHGTTVQAYKEILSGGAISKMKRHAVHMMAEKEPAWKAAKRWHKTPIILAINAKEMIGDGYKFGVSENSVWCTEEVPIRYISNLIYKP